MDLILVYIQGQPLLEEDTYPEEQSCDGCPCVDRNSCLLLPQPNMGLSCFFCSMQTIYNFHPSKLCYQKMILYRFEFCIIATCYFPILSWSVRMTCRVIHVVRGPLPLLSVVSSLEIALRLKSLHTEQRPPPLWAQLVPSLLHLTPRGPATLLECV